MQTAADMIYAVVMFQIGQHGKQRRAVPGGHAQVFGLEAKR